MTSWTGKEISSSISVCHTQTLIIPFPLWILTPPMPSIGCPEKIYIVFASESGPPESGPSEAGPSESGPSQSGPFESGTFEAGPSEAGTSESGPFEAGPSI